MVWVQPERSFSPGRRASKWCSADAALSHADTPGNVGEEQTLGTQRHDVPKPTFSFSLMDLIFAFHLLRRLLSPSLGVRERTCWLRRKFLGQEFLFRLTNVCTTPGKQKFEDIGKVANEVKPVSDLQRLGSAYSRGGSVIGSSIPTDNVYFGMLQQPLGEGLGFAVWQ